MKWEKVKLKQVVNNLDSKRKPLNDFERSKINAQGLYPYIGANNIMGYVDEYLFDETILCIAEDGGSWGAGQKCAVIYNGRTWVNNHAHVVTPKSNLDIRYLMYFLNFSDLNKHISGSTRGKLTKSSLEDIDIPLPSLPIQQQIADTLDKADALRRKDEELLDKYDELAQAVFYEMFGDPVRNEKGWEGQKLKDICTQITDGTHFSPPSVPVGVPYITAKHVKKHGLDFFANPTYIDENNHNEIYKRCRPEKGDVLYIKDGATTGLAAINDYDFEFSMLSSLALIKPNQSVLTSVFLKYWLNNNRVKSKLINEFMAGAAIQRFTLSKINQFQVYLPPLKLQLSFGEKIVKLEKIKLLHSKASNSSKSLFDALISKSFNN